MLHRLLFCSFECLGGCISDILIICEFNPFHSRRTARLVIVVLRTFIFVGKVTQGGRGPVVATGRDRAANLCGVGGGPWMRMRMCTHMCAQGDPKCKCTCVYKNIHIYLHIFTYISLVLVCTIGFEVNLCTGWLYDFLWLCVFQPAVIRVFADC